MKKNNKTINKIYATMQALHKSADEHRQRALELALKLGELLIAQKKAVGHGNWEQWCADNFMFSINTAKRYMRVYRNKSQLGEAKKVMVKTLRQAYIATGVISQEAVEKTKSDMAGNIKKLLAQATRKSQGLKTPKEKENLANQLRPIIDIYLALVK